MAIEVAQVAINLSSTVNDEAELDIAVTLNVRGSTLVFKVNTAEAALSPSQTASLKTLMNNIRTLIITKVKAEAKTFGDS